MKILKRRQKAGGSANSGLGGFRRGGSSQERGQKVWIVEDLKKARESSLPFGFASSFKFEALFLTSNF
ncbi:hypothetical protein L8106_27219 [Lyngbya sp. PCC 8106]|nr:hypothetical protein L8106_27219 [Lyngbya sp. PCC 8106]